MTVTGNQAPSGGQPDASTGQLVKQLSEQVSQLVREEMRLATLEPGRFTLSTIRARLDQGVDPWDGFAGSASGLAQASERLAGL